MQPVGIGAGMRQHPERPRDHQTCGGRREDNRTNPASIHRKPHERGNDDGYAGCAREKAGASEQAGYSTKPEDVRRALTDPREQEQ